MYTIKQAAARSGVSVQLVRAWERRYGVVEPARTESGYRLYDDDAIARLRAMRRLIDEGWAPSTAAGHVRDLDDAVVYEIADRSTVVAPSGSPAVARSALVAAFVDAAETLDESALERALDEMFSSGSFEHVASELIMPALVALGEAWASGRVDVAAEHAAAGAVERRLGMAFMAAGLPSDQRAVLVGLPPGSRHHLGALAFATAARRAGIGVRYLGADLPLENWLDVARNTSASAVVMGIVVGRDLKPAMEVAQAIRSARPDVLLAFGGRSAKSIVLDNLQPAVILPDDLSASVESLRAALPQ